MECFTAATEAADKNQYWYSAPTIAALVEGALELAGPGGRIAFLSTPSLFFSLPPAARAPHAVLDIDEQWAAVPGSANKAAVGADCPWLAKGPATLEGCEAGCGVTNGCNAFNWNAGDCEWRSCVDPMHPQLTDFPGWEVYGNAAARARLSPLRAARAAAAREEAAARPAGERTS
jgi:hypothetical protein